MSSVWPEVLEACRKFAGLGHGTARGRHKRVVLRRGPAITDVHLARIPYSGS